MKITLCEEDAEKLGCPRELTFDFENITGRDLLELEEQVGWSIDQLERALQGTPLVNAIGQPVYEMNGDVPKLDGMGKPIRAMGITSKTVVVMVWMCVRRANPDVAWKTFDFSATKAEFDPEDDGGKAQPSRTSTTTTKPRSRRSSASTRGTSARS